MPITPRFDLSQTDTHVNLQISVPHVRVSELQIDVSDDCVFHFASPPYLLLLDFSPNKLLYNEESGAAVFDPEQGVVRIDLPKGNTGSWTNLDLIGNLVIKRRRQPNPSWLKEVVSHETVEDENDDDNDIVHSSQIITNGKEFRGVYGFMRMFSDVYTDVVRDGMSREVLLQPWDATTASLLLLTDESIDQIYAQRRAERCRQESDAFHSDRYTQDVDILDDYIYQCAMSMRTSWHDTDFTSEEKAHLVSIPYPLLSAASDNSRLVLVLIDILFAYVYDHLTTDGDPTVESAWTINTLSATLSCLEDWSGCDVSTTVYSSLRRCLIYPYIRNIDFGVYVWKQVVSIISNESIIPVVKCMLQVRNVLEKHSDVYYLCNKVWIDPILTWLQANAEVLVKELRQIASTITDLVAVPIDNTKARLELGLLELEVGDLSGSSSESDESDSNDDDNDDDSSYGNRSESSKSESDAVISGKVTEVENVSQSMLMLNLS